MNKKPKAMLIPINSPYNVLLDSSFVLKVPCIILNLLKVSKSPVEAIINESPIPKMTLTLEREFWITLESKFPSA
ncbi:hypothetical protein WICPIJ_007859 [Wickerhamomyces pijperi]|uniref:Uncharacterized protein n=1 Tax=Wickerhamomyces pijperi TaxID=599730 RepID=A0A9P8Q1R5_WICPI|nr:hypothetical protein WICPIJ_007859 [Wickerhamomyces pijperi]